MAIPLAGQTVRASHYPKTKVIKKNALESVTSSTTFQDDDDFTVSLEANRLYLIRLFLVAAGAPAGDIKLDWTVTGGVAQYTTRQCRGMALAGTNSTDTTMRTSPHNLSTAVTYGVEATNGSIREEFLVETIVAGTSGTLTLRWAQNTSNATATSVSANSFMTIEEVEEI